MYSGSTTNFSSVNQSSIQQFSTARFLFQSWLAQLCLAFSPNTLLGFAPLSILLGFTWVINLLRFTSLFILLGFASLNILLSFASHYFAPLRFAFFIENQWNFWHTSFAPQDKSRSLTKNGCLETCANNSTFYVNAESRTKNTPASYVNKTDHPLMKNSSLFPPHWKKFRLNQYDYKYWCNYYEMKFLHFKCTVTP